MKTPTLAEYISKVSNFSIEERKFPNNSPYRLQEGELESFMIKAKQNEGKEELPTEKLIAYSSIYYITYYPKKKVIIHFNCTPIVSLNKTKKDLPDETVIITHFGNYALLTRESIEYEKPTGLEVLTIQE